MSSPSKSFGRWVLGLALLASAAAAVAALRATRPSDLRGTSGPSPSLQPVSLQLARPDPLEGGVAWINTAGPITLKELHGKVVILDFWTYCCINCHHVLPDLAKLEEKYKNQLVVIGVHTPKFQAERDTANIRQKVREYGVKHPVVSDADQVIWNHFGVTSWPTIGVFDPEGNVAFATSGEGHYHELDRVVGQLVAKYRGKGLNETPIQFFPENEKPDDTPLLYPGKVLADAPGGRLFISDTGHNRVVMTGLDGKAPVSIGAGTVGMTDGPFDKAQFHRPQGLVLVGETLYVADTENHAIRAVDLKARTVTTVAGTGEQAHGSSRSRTAGPALKTALNSPWDFAHVGDAKSLYVAMAGPHQIWKFDLETKKIGVWAGSGAENIVDGTLASAAFAQPSGLATDGKHLFVADSEGSAVRSIVLGNKAHVSTIAGTHDLPNGQSLFAFDDIDGEGPFARLQHCLGVAYGDEKLYIADTYNNKVKVYDPADRSVKTVGGSGKPGDFYQPGGLSVAGTKLYVSDTNNNRVRVVDLASDRVETLDIDSLTPPRPKARKPLFLNAGQPIPVPEAKVAAGDSLTLDVTLPVPAGYKLNREGKIPVLVETPGKPGLIDPEKLPETGEKVNAAPHFSIKVPLARSAKVGDKFDLKVSVQSLICSEGSSLCMIKSYVWNVPISVTTDGSDSLAIDSGGQ